MIVFAIWIFMLLRHQIFAQVLNPNYFEGDIILTPDERLNIHKYPFAASKFKWPTTVIPYDLHPNIGNIDGFLKNLTEAINDYHRYTCLKFVRRTNEYTYILFNQEQGCGAPLGYHSGANRISLQGAGCQQKGVIIHEIMHNLGFHHEQSRPDRDSFVKILWQNINPGGMKSQFEKRPGIDSLKSPYDYLSIMHYPKDGFAKTGTNTIEPLDLSYLNLIGQRTGLSKLDIEQLNTIYQCGKTTSAPITKIKPVGCADEYDNCASYKRYCNEHAWKDFMKHCKATCGLCNGSLTAATHRLVAANKQASTSRNTVQTLQAATSSSTNSCADKFDAKTCLNLVSNCNSKSIILKKYMEENCKQSCGFCQPKCGKSMVPQSRVIAGQTAKPGAWPWIVALYRDGIYACGGSLLSSQIVVTAAHCVAKDPTPNKYHVVAGDHNRKARDGFEQIRLVSKIDVHPTYNQAFRLNNDIAVITLTSPMVLNTRAAPVCLPEEKKQLEDDAFCFIAGWGKIKHPGYSHDVLQQAHLKLVENSKCHLLNSKSYNMTVTKQMICAGHGPSDSRSGCQGDSGGPFVCRHKDDTWVLEGIVSWGSSSCDTTKAYTVFTKVREYVTLLKNYL